MPFGNYKEFKGRTHFHVKIALVPGSEYKLGLVRRVNRDEVKMQTQHARMPGFRLKWYYTGNDVEAKPKQIQFKSFIRNDTKKFQFQRFYTGWQKFQLCAVHSFMRKTISEMVVLKDIFILVLATLYVGDCYILDFE